MLDLNNVLIRDLGGRISQAERWPLLIDSSDCARKLVQYAGCSVLNFWRPDDMQPERLRLALLAMLRCGGILAIDLFAFSAGVERDLLGELFEQIRPGLFA